MESVVLCCPLINKVFLVGWWRERGWWSRAPQVIGVEFGWRLLKSAEGPHFVVGVGVEPLRPSQDCCSYMVFFVSAMTFALGPGSFPETTLYLLLNLPLVFSHSFNHIHTISIYLQFFFFFFSPHQFSRKLGDGGQY